MCLVPGKVDQKPVQASSMFLTAQLCRDPAFSPFCAVTQAGGCDANPQTLGPSYCMILQLFSFPMQLAVVPQTWDCGFTSGWGSSIGWGGRGKGMQGKLASSESRQSVHPLQKTGRSQSLVFFLAVSQCHTCLIV